MDFQTAFKGMSDRMQIDFDYLRQVYQHRGNKGDSSVSILKKFLEDYLPQKYSIGRGEIIDSNGEHSDEQDMVIYDNLYCPKLIPRTSEDPEIFPCESVYGVIEVKSMLNTGDIKKSIENIRSVKRLSKTAVLPLSLAPGMVARGNAPSTIGIVFGFSSKTKIKTLARNLKNFNEKVDRSERINIVYLHNKGIITYFDEENGIRAYPTDKNRLVILPLAENTLVMFYLILLNLFTLSSVLPVDFQRYAYPTGTKIPIEEIQ